MMTHDFGFPYEILNESTPHCRAKELIELAEQLHKTFRWSKTREGIIFWYKAYEGLMRIAEKGS